MIFSSPFLPLLLKFVVHPFHLLMLFLPRIQYPSPSLLW